MASTVEEIMTRDPRTIDIGDSLVDAAREMRDRDIGNVIVTDGGRVAGIITDRDIVVRAIAEGRDLQSTTVGDVCSAGPRTLEPGEAWRRRLRRWTTTASVDCPWSGTESWSAFCLLATWPRTAMPDRRSPTSRPRRQITRERLTLCATARRPPARRGAP